MIRVIALSASFGLAAAAGCQVTREPEPSVPGGGLLASAVDDRGLPSGGTAPRDADGRSVCRNDARGVIRGDFYAAEGQRPLSELIGIREVTGTLTIEGTESEQLEELSCLRRAGSLHIVGNPDLVGLRGLSRLREIEGDLHIVGNAQLGDLRGLSELRGTIGLLPLDRCTPAPEYACETAFVIADNPSLETLAGLDGIEEIAGHGRISGNGSLVDLDGLGGLHTVDELAVTDNLALTDLSALSSLESAFTLVISENAALAVLGPLPALAYADHLHIVDNESLTSIALPALQGVGGLLVRGNTRLRSLSGLEGVREVALGLVVDDNDNLESLAALANATGPMGRLPLWLIDRAGLADALEPWVDDGVTVRNNRALRSLDGLQGIAAIGGGLRVSSNDRLTDLRGLDGLVSVGSSIAISNNPALESLDGLRALEHVAGDVWITHNPRLFDVGALSGLERDGAMHLEANPLLSAGALGVLIGASSPEG
jgi:hypothetical protein